MRVLTTTFALSLAASSFTQTRDSEDAERRIIQYVQDNLKPGEPLIVSKLYNEVFTQSRDVLGPAIEQILSEAKEVSP